MVEIIVVLVILGVWIAVATPAYLGFINKHQESAAKIEARVVVNAALMNFQEQYGNNSLSQTSAQTSIPHIMTVAATEGTILDLSANLSDATVATMLYYTSEGKYVEYKHPDYFVYDEMPLGSTVIGYLNTSKSLIDRKSVG